MLYPQAVALAVLEICPDKPSHAPLSQQCNMHPCISFEAKAGPWQECSAKCGGGIQHRSVSCVAAGIFPVPNEYCDNLPSEDQVSFCCRRYFWNKSLMDQVMDF